MRCAFLLCRFMRKATVGRRLASIQHSSGCSMLPNMMRRLRIFWIASAVRVIATPATISLKPERYLVAEYKVISAPSSNGCWNVGPRNVLSTMTTGLLGWRDAACAARSISVMISVGLAGVSRYTMQQFGAAGQSNADHDGY